MCSVVFGIYLVNFERKGPCMPELSSLLFNKNKKERKKERKKTKIPPSQELIMVLAP
jgi:hypothetical protein